MRRRNKKTPSHILFSPSRNEVKAFANEKNFSTFVKKILTRYPYLKYQYIMRGFILTTLAILLLSFSHTTYAQQQEKEYTYQVKIVNSKGKPQPNIYAYLKGGDKRKFFKSDANGVLTFIIDGTNVDEWTPVLIIDHERSGGYCDGYVSLRKDTIIYDTKEDVQNLLKAGKPLQANQCEEAPEYPGGISECMRYITKEVIRIMKGRNMSVYDLIYGGNGFPGRTIIRFVIDEEGNVTSPEILRGVDPVLDKIGVEVIKSIPKWKPARVEGKPVPCIYVLPVMYRLQ